MTDSLFVLRPVLLALLLSAAGGLGTFMAGAPALAGNQLEEPLADSEAASAPDMSVEEALELDPDVIALQEVLPDTVCDAIDAAGGEDDDAAQKFGRAVLHSLQSG